MHAAHTLLPQRFTVSVRPANDSDVLARFERALEDAITGALGAVDDSPVDEHVRWHFGLGTEHAARRGKRLRPRLLFQIACDEGGTFEAALDAAVAVEMLHNYSLVHDDIEDGDVLRHGRETVWARYGLASGINAGDAMSALTYLTLLRNSSGAPLERVTAMMRALLAANLAMCAGQAFDIGFESATHVTMDAYLAMIDGKTATLFGAACALGALAAGADAERASAYGAFGRAYGRAFQIRDDEFGTWGSCEETGKNRGADIAHRKWSFPIVWALAGPPSSARDAIATRYARTGPLDAGDIETIVAALDVLDARSAANRTWRRAVADADALAARYQLDRRRALRNLFADGSVPAVRAVS